MSKPYIRQTIEDSFILERNDDESLNRELECFAKSGYEPQGGVTVAVDPDTARRYYSVLLVRRYRIPRSLQPS